MGLFSKKNDTPAAAPVVQTPAAQTAPHVGVDLGKKSGAISLVKGSSVTIEKTPVIRARASWSSNTDYDLYALVLTRDGKVHTVSTFGTENDKNGFNTSVLNGAVRHLGDVGREAKGQAEETIEIKLTPDIVAVVPVAYSAQSNGTGSFRHYKVSLSIDNGAGTNVSISADSAADNKTVYSVGIGIIRNTADGVQIEALEAYSAPGSELRAQILAGGVVKMDAGPRNAYK